MTSKRTKRDPLENLGNYTASANFLILHNDDVHSFDYVALALMEVCGHSVEQATQCTLLTHYQGKCDVKKGRRKMLTPLKDALIERNLNATID